MDADHDAQIAELVAELALDEERESVASEIGVLQSIYEPGSLRLWRPEPDTPAPPPGTLRYEVHLNLPHPHDAVPLRILVSLPAAYPVAAPPQLQLLSRYIGAFAVDAALFGAVLRTYISTLDGQGVEFAPGAECVFDGVQSVLERCARWYEDKLSEEAAGEMVREMEHQQTHQPDDKASTVSSAPQLGDSLPVSLPTGLQLIEAEPITDRKSAFIGRACRITDPAQVPLVLAHLMADRRTARAAHPIINAWRCQVGTVLHQDNDDDGETAAGGRLGHLLQILDVTNVLVIVTRYFGGIHLGPDRFKHINQAARNALDLGGFLDDDKGKDGGKGASKAAPRKKR